MKISGRSGTEVATGQRRIKWSPQSEIKKRKQELLHDIKLLDAQAEDGGLTEEEWATRYNLEEQKEGY